MQQMELERVWFERLSARAACVVAAPHVPAALGMLGLVRPQDRVIAFADDFADPLAEALAPAEVRFVESPSVEMFAAGKEAPNGGARTFWFINSIGGYGLRVPDLRALGKAAEAAGALLVVDNTVASHFGCHPHDLGATVALEALDRICGGAAPRKLVAVSVARSQRKRHRVDARAEWAFGALGGVRAQLEPLSVADIAAVEEGIATCSLRMQMHMDRARAIAEYLRANEMVPAVSYPGLACHPDHIAAASSLLHGFGPAVGFELPAGLSAARFIDSLPGRYRTAPAGGRYTRVSAIKGSNAPYIRLFAGLDDPINVADDLDQALRLFCNPPEPL